MAVESSKEGARRNDLGVDELLDMLHLTNAEKDGC